MRLIDKDLARLHDRLIEVSKGYSFNDMRASVERSAQVFVDKAQQLAPEYQAGEVHHRRDVSGKVVASYYKGNLKRSIRILKHLGAYKAAKTTLNFWGIFIGPLVAQMGTKGTFAGDRVDGWYAHIQEFGAMLRMRDGSRIWMPGKHFMSSAFTSMKSIAHALLLAAYEKRIDDKIRKFNLSRPAA